MCQFQEGKARYDQFFLQMVKRKNGGKVMIAL
ncbi:TPA: hypothetical protein ACWW18_003746 [Klebsiella variicola subsp. variicola]